MVTALSHINFPIPYRGVIKEGIDRYYLPEDALFSSQNVLFRDGQFETRPGLVELGSTSPASARMNGLFSYESLSDSRRIIKSNQNGWFIYNDITGLWEDITGTAPVILADIITFKIFPRAGTNWVIGQDSENPLRAFHPGLAAYRDVLGGPPARASVMAVAGAHLILGGISPGGRQDIDVSADFDFDSGWGAIQTETLNQTPGFIAAMHELGEFNAVIYKSDSIHIAQFVGQLSPFRFPLMVSNIRGPINRRAVTTIGDGRHAFLGADYSLKIYSGGSFISDLIVNGINVTDNIRNILLEKIPQTLSIGVNAFSVVYDADNNELWVHYPVGPGRNFENSIAINLKTGAISPALWGISSNPATYGKVRTGITLPTVERQIIGEIATDKVYMVEGDSDAGLPIVGHWETGMKPISTSGNQKLLEEMENYLNQTTAPTTLNVQVLTSNNGGTPVVAKTVPITTDGTSRRLNGLRVEAKFIGLRYEFSNLEKLTWRGADLFVRERGRR